MSDLYECLQELSLFRILGRGRDDGIGRDAPPVAGGVVSQRSPAPVQAQQFERALTGSKSGSDHSFSSTLKAIINDITFSLHQGKVVKVRLRTHNYETYAP